MRGSLVWSLLRLGPAPFLIKPAGLGAVAAVFHIAPATALIAAGIQKKPAAGRIETGLDPFQFVRRHQQVRGGTDHRVQNPIQGTFVAV